MACCFLMTSCANLVPLLSTELTDEERKQQEQEGKDGVDQLTELTKLKLQEQKERDM